MWVYIYRIFIIYIYNNSKNIYLGEIYRFLMFIVYIVYFRWRKGRLKVEGLKIKEVLVYFSEYEG